jgi:ATP-dependent Clp protease ATP-binding subunit ClpA
LRVEERGAEQARNILRQVVPRFERKHRVIIGDDVVTEIIRLDQRYEGRLKGQSPNRQVEFLDQLAASVNIGKYGKPVDLLKQEMELVDLLAEEELLKTSAKPSTKKIKEVLEKIKALQAIIQPQLDVWTKRFVRIRAVRQDLLEAQNLVAPLQAKYERYQTLKEKEATRRQFNAAAKSSGEEVAALAPEDVPQPLTQDENRTRDAYIRAERQLRNQLAELEKGVYAETPQVTVADVQARFSKISGVSAKAVSTNDAERLLKVEDGISANVYGQDHAKATLANIYRTREQEPAIPPALLAWFF